MEGTNWSSAPAPNGSTADWRSQLQPDARQRIVNKIMDTLKRHLSICAPEGVSELQRIATRFEEKIYSSAANQSDYLRKISLRMLSMEHKRQHNGPMNPSMPNNTVLNQNPADPEGNEEAFDEQLSDVDGEVFDVANSSSIPQCKLNSTTSTSSRISKRKHDDLALKVASEKLDMLMNCMKECTTALIKHDTPEYVEKEYTKKEIFEALNKLNLPHEYMINAYIALAKSKENTQIFFSVPEGIRVEILSRLMNA